MGLAAGLALLFAGFAVAASVTVPTDADRMDLGDAFEYHADPTGRQKVAELAAGNAAFSSLGRRELNRGFSRDTHWLRITFVNPADAPVTRWLEVGDARLQSVRMFWHDDGAWRELATGTLVPRGWKPVMSATPVLPLTLAPYEERTVFIRIASETVVTMGAMLWDPLAFRSEETSYFLTRGAFLSALLLAATFAFLIYLLMRDRVYLLFALALLFQVGFEGSMDGVIPRYLWPAAWPFATGVISLCSGLALFFHTLFLRAFLDLRTTQPFWGRVLVALAGVALLAALGRVFHDYRLWVQVMTLDAVMVVVLAPSLSLVLLRRGYRPARFMLVGLSVFWAAVLVSQIMLLGLVPTWAPAAESLPLATVLASTLILLAITERTRELREALAHADAANEAKTTFLAHMSHELRTPLNTVIGFARLLHKGGAHVTPQEGGRAIERSGLHLLSMIDELLDHARGELGKLRLAPTPTEWGDFINTITESAREMTRSAGNTFQFDVDGAVPAVVMVDARRLRQVLENLLANANRYTHGGGVTLVCHVEAATAPANVRLRFRVIDTGEGIASVDVERIFEPFQRGAAQATERGAQGAGLGLAISGQLVALMGGALRLENTSPQGSTFGFAIECAVLDAGDVALAMDASPRPTLAAASKTLLVAEDEPASRALLAGMLRAAGFSVVEAASGRAALARLGAQVDLVLTDQFMADGDGWEVLRGARAFSPSMPVVLVSAVKPQRPSGFPDQINFDETLQKPVDDGQLFSLIERLLALEARTAPALTSPVDGIPPAQRRAELARLVTNGQVTDIKEWARELAAASPAWAEYAARVIHAVLRLDFTELARLAADESEDS
jgi:signal transduction histidine kinase/DNA-binding NarL/FixJ family response regulator